MPVNPDKLRGGVKGHVATTAGARQPASVALTITTRQGAMKKKRSGNWDLMYGFGFLVLFILVHTMFITHETRSYKQESSNMSGSDFIIQRARKLKQSRKELMEAVDKMREPSPGNRNEALALAVNSVYRRNLRQRNLIIPLRHSDNSTDARLNFYRDECRTRNLTELDLTDCVLDNEMAARKAHLQHKCDKMKASTSKLLPFVDSKKIFVLKYRKLVWCPVYKAASTNWLNNLPALSNFRASQIKILKRRFIQANELAGIVAKPMPLIQFRKYVSTNDPIKFLIVRHPFDRLLSAYRDKLERMNQHFYSKYGKSIVENYRHLGIRKFGAKFYSQKNGSVSSCQDGLTQCDHGDGSTPTFWEFVKALLDGEIEIDDHWSPIHISCSICRLSYDLVLHFEYLNEEQPYLLRQLGLDSLVLPDAWQNHKSPNPLTHAQKLEYFNLLNEDEIWGLYNFYKLDFDLFQYDLNSYLKVHQ